MCKCTTAYVWFVRQVVKWMQKEVSQRVQDSRSEQEIDRATYKMFP